MMSSDNLRKWVLNRITLSAHWNAGWPYDQTATYDSRDLEYPWTHLGRPRVWESWGKHANYRNADICNGQEFDRCTSGSTHTVYDDLAVLSNANLGNFFTTEPPTDHRIVNCVTSRDYPSVMPGTECYWEGSVVFAGWFDYHGQDAATKYSDMLYLWGF